MQLDHERLDVYSVMLDFVILAEEVVRELPRGQRYYADQLRRAAGSMTLNLAEGCGKGSKGDRRRYFLSARGSAMESAAILDILERLQLLQVSRRARGKELLVRIVSMLSRLVQSCASDEAA